MVSRRSISNLVKFMHAGGMLRVADPPKPEWSNPTLLTTIPNTVTRDVPEWANNPIGRELIAAILSNPPEGRLIRDDWGTRDHRSYAGKIAGRLRQMHTEWRQAEFSKCDREFAVTGMWDQRRANEVCGAPDANQLIEQLVGDPLLNARAA